MTTQHVLDIANTSYHPTLFAACNVLNHLTVAELHTRQEQISIALLIPSLRFLPTKKRVSKSAALSLECEQTAECSEQQKHGNQLSCQLLTLCHIPDALPAAALHALKPHQRLPCS